MPAPATLLLRTLVAAAALPALALAQAPVVLVQDGDVVSGVGAVTSIDNLVVNSSGQWIVEVDTDNPDTSVDGALLKNGVLYLREGQALAAPAGATLGSFDAVTLSATGRSGWNFFLDNTSGTSDDSGIFYDDALVLQEGTVSGAAGFSPGTPYIGFFETKVNASDRILVMASVDDPAIATSVDRALVVFQVDAAGTLLSETVLYKEGDVLPGQTDAVADFGTGPHAFDFNEAGQVLFIADLAGSTSTDGCVYLDGTLLAQEGSPSPVAGRNWASLSTSNRVALGNGGDYAYTGSLDGSSADNSVIIRNNALFRQEGDSLPAIAPWSLTSFGSSAPVEVDAAGNVVWFGDWDDPDTTRDTGLFLNGTLLVQEGVTQVGGVVIESLAGVQDGFDLSPDGRYLVFEGKLAGGVDAAFAIDLAGCASPVTYCTASTTSLPGCVAAIGSSGFPTLGAPASFTISSGAVPGKRIGLMYFSGNGRAALPFGTQGGFVCVQLPGFRLPPQSSGGTSGLCDGEYRYSLQDLLDKAPGVVVAGQQVNAALWFRDPPSPDGFGLSDGIEFVVCP